MVVQREQHRTHFPTCTSQIDRGFAAVASDLEAWTEVRNLSRERMEAFTLGRIEKPLDSVHIDRQVHR